MANMADPLVRGRILAGLFAPDEIDCVDEQRVQGDPRGPGVRPTIYAGFPVSGKLSGIVAISLRYRAHFGRGCKMVAGIGHDFIVICRLGAAVRERDSVYNRAARCEPENQTQLADCPSAPQVDRHLYYPDCPGRDCLERGDRHGSGGAHGRRF